MLLRQLREERKLYQKDIAKMLGVDRTTYVKYENETSEPPIDTLIQLASFYAVSIEHLLGLPEGPISHPNVTSVGSELPQDAMDVAIQFMSLSSENKAFVRKQIDLLLAQQTIEKESNAV